MYSLNSNALFNMSSSIPVTDPFYERFVGPFSELEINESLKFLGYKKWEHLQPSNCYIKGKLAS